MGSWTDGRERICHSAGGKPAIRESDLPPKKSETESAPAGLTRPAPQSPMTARPRRNPAKRHLGRSDLGLRGDIILALTI